MTQKQALDLWLAGANDALDTAKKLYSVKKFDHCLFFVHLALEKILIDEISKFNISARYDDIKLKFYKKATAQYATLWLGNAEALYQKFQSIL